MKRPITHKVVLGCISANPGCTVGDVARLSHLHRATVSAIVAKLATQGLATRARPRTRGDRRRIHLELTSKGVEALHA